MIKGMPSIPGIPPTVSDSIIGFGGAFAINMIFGNQWGVYSQYGIPILLADTVLSTKYQNSSQISQAPLEKGTFASYNKVQDPYKATVTLVKGGSNPALRGAFLAQIDALSRSTILYNVVTPEFVHQSANIIGYDYVREPQAGATMLTVNLHLEEVREVDVELDSTAADETENPEDSATQDAGEVQPEEAGESLLSRIVGKGEQLADQFMDTVGGMIDEFSGVVVP